MGNGYRTHATVLSFKKPAVKTDGPQQPDKPDGYAEVVFDGPEIFGSPANSLIRIGARATGIRNVQHKA